MPTPEPGYLSSGGMDLQAEQISSETDAHHQDVMVPAAITWGLDFTPAIHGQDIEQAEQSHTTKKQYCGQIAIGRQVGDGP